MNYFFNKQVFVCILSIVLFGTSISPGLSPDNNFEEIYDVVNNDSTVLKSSEEPLSCKQEHNDVRMPSFLFEEKTDDYHDHMMFDRPSKESKNIKTKEKKVMSTGIIIIVPDDYPTIQQAVDHAENGDTVYVRAETYYEHVSIDKQLTLQGGERF